MGIPKFYRWMSERYPCLSQVVAESEVCVRCAYELVGAGNACGSELRIQQFEI